MSNAKASLHKGQDVNRPLAQSLLLTKRIQEQNMTVCEIIYIAGDECKLVDSRGCGNQHIRLGACLPFGL
jgi:hypothetical protein